MGWEIDIGQIELYRHHWAVKDVDLEAALVKSGLAADGILPKAEQPEDDAPHDIPVRFTIFHPPTGPQQEDLVSVMMPLHPAFDRVHLALRNACAEAGFQCQRADDIWENDVVMDDIFALIFRSKFVICDFTDKNANVFYEAGIAHTLGRTVVPVTQHENDVPFDLRHRRFLLYDDNEQGRLTLANKVAARLRTLREQGVA